MELKDAKKILVINLGGIGDILLSLPALKALRGAYKGAVLDIMVVERAGECVRNAGFFDSIFLYEKNIMENIHRVMELRRNRYDLVINMRTMVSASSALKIRLLLNAIRGKVWAGRDTDGHGHFFDIRQQETGRGDAYEMEYDVGLIEKLGAKVEDRRIAFTISPESAKKMQEILRKEAIPDGDVIIGIHPGGKPSHRWPLEYFAETMQIIARAVQCSFVITGDDDEIRLADNLLRASGVKALNMAGRLTIEELGALIRRCDVFISNDTAAMHIAAIVQTPLVAIFGPGYLPRYDPRVIFPEAVVLYKKAPCAPCDRTSCTTTRCLKVILPEEAAKAALILMERHGKKA